MLAGKLLEVDVGKNAGPFGTNGIQLRGIDVERFEDGWRHLGGPNLGADRLRLEGRMRHQQNDVGVGMGEPAVLGQLCFAARVSDAHVRGYDDVRRPRIYGRVIEVERKRGAVVDLPERDSGCGSIIFKDFDAGFGIGGAL